MIFLSVWSPKGGVGKTTLATNLASGFIEKGKTVLVIDMDYHEHQGAKFGQQSAYNLQQAGKVKWDAVVGMPKEEPTQDVIIIDCKPGYESPVTPIVIIPQPLSKIDLDALQASKRLLDKDSHILRVATLYNGNNQDQQAILGELRDTFDGFMMRRSTYQRATNLDMTVFEMNPKLYGVRDCKSEINKIIMGVENGVA